MDLEVAIRFIKLQPFISGMAIFCNLLRSGIIDNLPDVHRDVKGWTKQAG